MSGTSAQKHRGGKGDLGGRKGGVRTSKSGQTKTQACRDAGEGRWRGGGTIS